MRKLLILILCLLSFNICAFALPEIPSKQLPQFKIDAQNVLDTINSKPTCVGNKTYRQYIINLYNQDYKLYQDFKKNPFDKEKNSKTADLFLEHSSSLDGLADGLLDDMDILFTKYSSTINYENVNQIKSGNTFDFLYQLFKKYNISGYQEFKELLSLSNEIQDSILNWREEVRKYVLSY